MILHLTCHSLHSFLFYSLWCTNPPPIHIHNTNTISIQSQYSWGWSRMFCFLFWHVFNPRIAHSSWVWNKLCLFNFLFNLYVTLVEAESILKATDFIVAVDNFFRKIHIMESAPHFMLSTCLNRYAFMWKEVILKIDNKTLNESQLVGQRYKKIWKMSIKRKKINTFNHNCNLPSIINLFCIILLLKQGLILFLSGTNSYQL